MSFESEATKQGADLELESRITESLQKLYVPSLRNVTVEARRGTVVLRGEVNTFYAKQLSQHSARLAGENRVIDEVSVIPPCALADRRRRASASAGVVTISISPTNSLLEPEAR